MSGVDKQGIIALRKELACTRRELAAALGVELDIVRAWENGERFPTKKAVAALEALRREGPGGVLRKSRGASSPAGASPLEDPRLGTVFKKLLEDPELFEEVVKLVDARAKQPGRTNQ